MCVCVGGGGGGRFKLYIIVAQLYSSDGSVCVCIASF